MSLPVQVLVVSLSWSPVTIQTPTHIFVTQKFFASAHLTTYQRCVQYIKGFVYRIIPGKWLEAEAAKFGGAEEVLKQFNYPVQVPILQKLPHCHFTCDSFLSQMKPMQQRRKLYYAEVDQPAVLLPRLCNICPLQHANIVLLANTANKNVCKPCC